MDRRPKILVVEDEHLNRKVLETLLKGENQVFLAKDGEQALKRAEETPDLDLILLDLVMPGTDGYEVLRRLKTMNGVKDIPVIIITALGSRESEALGFELGAVDYVRKPFNPDIVKERVEAHLARGGQRA